MSKAKKTIKYPYLPEGRAFKYVGPENKFMKEAYKAAKELSTDRRHSTGMILVKNGGVIMRAGNQVPIKNSWFQKYHSKGIFCVRRWLNIPTGKGYWMCPGCSKSKNHAESTSIKEAKKKGIDTNGADAYLWGHWWACETCWKNLIEGGIKNVYLREDSEILFNRDNPNNILGWKKDQA